MLNYENNEDKIWPVFSNCDSVQIKSAMFKTEEDGNFVTIGDIEYSGTAQIDRIVSTNFTVKFHSDSMGTSIGFMLHWHCVQPYFYFEPNNQNMPVLEIKI